MLSAAILFGALRVKKLLLLTSESLQKYPYDNFCHIYIGVLTNYPDTGFIRKFSVLS